MLSKIMLHGSLKRNIPEFPIHIRPATLKKYECNPVRPGVSKSFCSHLDRLAVNSKRKITTTITKGGIKEYS
jgi:hypothetical protein